MSTAKLQKIRELAERYRKPAPESKWESAVNEVACAMLRILDAPETTIPEPPSRLQDNSYAGLRKLVYGLEAGQRISVTACEVAKLFDMLPESIPVESIEQTRERLSRRAALVRD